MRLAGGRVPQPGLALDAPAAVDEPQLARDLVLDRVLDELERVDVLELGARAEAILAAPAHRHVRVAAQLALLHVGLGDAEPAHEPVQRAHELGGLDRRVHHRLGHDLDERHARAVEIDVRGRARVRIFPRVFFEMDARGSTRRIRRR